jgi:hypothetical protein
MRGLDETWKTNDMVTARLPAHSQDASADIFSKNQLSPSFFLLFFLHRQASAAHAKVGNCVLIDAYRIILSLLLVLPILASSRFRIHVRKFSVKLQKKKKKGL